MIDIQSPVDGTEMLVAPDFPVALVVAAVPVLVPLPDPLPEPEPVVVAPVAVGADDPV